MDFEWLNELGYFEVEFNIWLVSTIIVTIAIAVVILKKRSK